jgi:hypothetical protein
MELKAPSGALDIGTHQFKLLEELLFICECRAMQYEYEIRTPMRKPVPTRDTIVPVT